VDIQQSGANANSNTQTAFNLLTTGANTNAAQTTYGAIISNTHSGTTSTNIGAQFTASGGATDNKAINVTAGIIDSVGSVRSTGNATASTGTGAELLVVSGSGVVQAYNRTGAAYVAMLVDGNPLTLNSNSAQGVVIGAPTGTNKGSGTLNIAGAYYANGTVGVTAGSFSTITAITTATGITTQLTGSSDARLKDVAGPYLPGLEAVKRLHPVRYHWNALAGEGPQHLDRTREFAGLLAQNLEDAIPEAVGWETWSDGSTWKQIDERRVLMAIINAIQELDARTAPAKSQ
jgi:hypothetical protein